ncbi:SfnB family sulfur acquisition oxidoreductase [Castellaniella sp.]|uniref:SfnB family sulfur acquisition oxidoreductase n=1 Tax=Castellaniella sp. TaxID=1955812 RepID=UPI002AFF82B7|nr:SfnB family sulfur acquisition oxidoreductase [Castellaniella sp.]
MSAKVTFLTPTHAPDIDAVELARTLADDFAREAADRDRERRLPFKEMKQLLASGLHGLRIPRAYGGREVSFVDMAQAVLEIARGDPNIAQSIQPHLFFLEVLRLDATEEQRRHWYGKVLEGSLITNAFAERGGRTIGEVNTRLVREQGRLLLRGRKYYCTGSLFADYLFVSANTEEGERILAIVPRKREGFTIEDDWDGMGQRTTASGTAILNDVPVEEYEVIRQPLFGKQRSYVGAAAQIYHAAIDAGIARAALDEALVNVRNNARPMPEAGVERQSEDPYVLHATGEMAVSFHQAEAMLQRAARALDHAASAQLEGTLEGEALERALAESSIAVAEAKASANATSLIVGEAIYRLGSASATLRRHNFDRHWRNARTHTTHDPVSYKYRAIGEYLLNDRLPPVSTKI